jgi:hypothetical protein
MCLRQRVASRGAWLVGPALVGGLLASSVGACRLGSANSAGTSVMPDAGAWSAPRTADGHPDLGGVWISRSATPVERPAALAERDRLTDEEVADLSRRAARIFSSEASDFAAGDAVFLAALQGESRFKSVTSTHNADEMVAREFDHHTSLVVDPADGRIPAQTPEGQRRRTQAAAALQRPSGPEDLGNPLRCLAWGVPRLGGRYGAGDLSYYQIVQSPTAVALYFEVGHEARIVPLDGRPHLPPHLRLVSGDSRGRWDGDTLVVDTTNFSTKSFFMGAGEGLHLVERFTRVAQDTISYEMVLEDPDTWARRWTAVMPLKRVTDRLFEFACHEGNYGIMTGMLSAARSDDRKPPRPVR